MEQLQEMMQQLVQRAEAQQQENAALRASMEGLNAQVQQQSQLLAQAQQLTQAANAFAATVQNWPTNIAQAVAAGVSSNLRTSAGGEFH